MAAWNKEFAFVLQASWERKEVKRWNGVMILRFWLFVEKRAYLQKMLPRGEVVTRVQSNIAVSIANVGGDVKLFLCVAYWMYQIHIQLRNLGLRKITKESMY